MLNEKQTLELLEVTFKSKDNNNTLNQLKIKFFNLEAKYQELLNQKEKIDKSAKRQSTLRLLFLLIVLIIQTYVFAKWIWAVDYLGWDLVEPMTFLVSSLIFIGGLFFYVKLNRNSISGEKIFSHITQRVQLRRYLKYNFNYTEFEKVEIEKNNLRRIIDDYYNKH